VNIKCFYAKSTCLGSNYRNINSLTLVQKVIPGYLQGADLIEWGAILVEVNFYHSLSSQLRVLTISRIVCGSLHIHAKHVKCGWNDAVNELGTVHVLVVICRLSDWLNKTESNRCPRASSSPQSFAPFIKAIPASVPISDWRSKNIHSYRSHCE
jgi:hypothetical protein